MGKIRTGAGSGFSGKAGSVIGSSRKETEYIRKCLCLHLKPKNIDDDQMFGFNRQFLADKVCNNNMI